MNILPCIFVSIRAEERRVVGKVALLCYEYAGGYYEFQYELFSSSVNAPFLPINVIFINTLTKLLKSCGRNKNDLNFLHSMIYNNI